MIMNDRWSFISFDQRHNYVGLRSERRVKDGFLNRRKGSTDMRRDSSFLNNNEELI